MLRKLIFLTTFFGCVNFCAYSQCVETPTDPCVSVSQSVLDRMAKALRELEAQREAAAAFLKERAANEAERLAWQNVSKATDAAIAALQKGLADRDKIIELWEKAFNSAMALADHYHKQLTKGKSGFAKFVDALKNVTLILVGAALGRGL